MKLHRWGTPILVLIARVKYGLPPTPAQLRFVQQQLEILHATKVITLEPFDLDLDKPFTLTPEDLQPWDIMSLDNG